MIKAWISKLLGRDASDRMDCHRVGELLQLYLDDLVDADRADEIAAHLEACRRCGMEAETYERIKGTLAGCRPSIPQDSADRLRDFCERLVSGDVRPDP